MSAGSRTVLSHVEHLLQVANNYEKDVFNGDQGFVRSISSGPPSSLTVGFPPAAGATEEGDERLVTYQGREVDELDLAWATTAHKAQGGEAKGVLLALAAAQRPLLSRRLLYTGLFALLSMWTNDSQQCCFGFWILTTSLHSHCRSHEGQRTPGGCEPAGTSVHSRRSDESQHATALPGAPIPVSSTNSWHPAAASTSGSGWPT